MSIAKFSVHRPVTTIMIILCVVVLGLFSIQFLPLNAFPDVSFPNLSVNVQYNSSSPREVEKLITVPLEDALSTVTHLKEMRSFSSNNSSRVRLEFESGTDMDLAAMEIRDKMDQIKNELPGDVRRVQIWRFQPDDWPVLVLNISMDGDRGKLYDLVEHVIKRRLERIEGVGNVEVWGQGEREIFVNIDQERLQAHGIDLYTLYQSIRTNNRNLSAGYVYDAGKKYSLRIVGEFQNVEEIEDTPLRGGSLRLRDIADVRYDFPEQRWFRRLNGVDATMLAIRKSSTGNTVDVAAAVKKEIVLLETDPRLEGVHINIDRDQSEEILNGIRGLLNSGLLGAVFAAVVLFFFLRKIRSMLIIELAVPISMICAFFIMYLARTFFGSTISLNMVSLSGLMVCVGMLLDNSVVVLENIYRHRQEGDSDARRAAIEGTSEVGLAVVAATATSIIVFVPMMFMSQSRMMVFMKDFGIVVCVALISSLLIAMTLVPLLASRFFAGEVRERLPFILKMMSLYERIMRWTLRWRFTTVLMAGGVFAVSYFLFTKIERTYSHPAPVRELEYRIEVPRSYSRNDLHNLFREIESILLSRKDELDIKNILSNYGFGGGDWFSRGSRLTVYLKDIAESKNATTLDVQKKIDRLLPVLPGVVYRFGGMRGFSGQSVGIGVEVKGRNPDLLAIYAERLKEKIAVLDGITNIETNLESGEQEVNLRVNRVLAQNFRITPRQVASSINSALSTRATTYFKSENGEVPITVRYREEDRSDIRDLENMTFESADSLMIPVSSLIDYEIKKGPENIERYGRQSVVDIDANTDRGGVMALRKELEQIKKDFRLPAGYEVTLGDVFRNTREFEQNSIFAFLMAVVLIYIIMAALFESLITPFAIIFSVPFALLGVFIIMVATQQSLNDMSMLGILILVGIVVNNGIILVDYVNQLRSKGMPRTEAIIKGGSIRLRPILMTAATTVLGILPMTLPIILPSVFGPAEGRAGSYGAIGLVIIGGLTTSTALTLIITPTIYSLMDDISRGFRQIIRKVFIH